MTNDQLQTILKIIDDLKFLKLKIMNSEAGDIANMPDLNNEDLVDLEGEQEDTKSSDWQESNKTF